MPQNDKDKYTDKQKRKAEHIEESYEDRGTPKDEAERRAWATVNKESGGGNKSGSGRGKADTHESSKKGGKIGWRSIGDAIGGGSIGLSQEGSRNPEAQRSQKLNRKGRWLGATAPSEVLHPVRNAVISIDALAICAVVGRFLARLI